MIDPADRANLNQLLADAWSVLQGEVPRIVDEVLTEHFGGDWGGDPVAVAVYQQLLPACAAKLQECMAAELLAATTAAQVH